MRDSNNSIIVYYLIIFTLQFFSNKRYFILIIFFVVFLPKKFNIIRKIHCFMVKYYVFILYIEFFIDLTKHITLIKQGIVIS